MKRPVVSTPPPGARAMIIRMGLEGYAGACAQAVPPARDATMKGRICSLRMLDFSSIGLVWSSLWPVGTTPRDPGSLLRLEPGFLRDLGEQLDPVRVAFPEVFRAARRRLVPGGKHLFADVRHRERAADRAIECSDDFGAHAGRPH